MVGSQAVLNVLTGERYKLSPNEIKTYHRWLRTSSREVNQEVRTKILGGDLPFTPTNPNKLESEYEKNYTYLENLLRRSPLEEEVVAYTIFPTPVEDYLRRNQAQPRVQALVNEPQKRDDIPTEMKTYRVSLEGQDYIVELEELTPE